MAKKRGASQQLKAPSKKAADRNPSAQQTPQVAALPKLEKVVPQHQGSPKEAPQTPGRSAQPSAALTSVSSAKFDTLTFILGCVVAVAIAVGGYYWLSSIQEPVSQAFSTKAVRLN